MQITLKKPVEFVCEPGQIDVEVMETVGDIPISLGEDEILIDDKNNTYAVFDGLGSLIKYRDKDGRTGGRIAAEIARDTLAGNSGSLRDAALTANKRIRKAMEAELDIDFNDTDNKPNFWSTFLVAVRWHEDTETVDYLRIGDCLILAILRDGSPKLMTRYPNHDLETMRRWRKLADKGLGYGEIRQELKDQIDDVRKRVNDKTFHLTYGALNGEDTVEDFLETGVINIQEEGIDTLLIFTDGYRIPRKSVDDEEDWNLFVDKYQKHGLKGLLEYIRELENNDPECLKFPRFKKHDDSAAIALKFQ
jgi:serine/threonine protein phosphatase PrpC